MQSKDIDVINRLGLHARAAAKLVHTANRFSCEVRIGRGDETVNAKSILGLLTLAASKGTRLHVSTDGEDESDAIDAIDELFADRFGEPE